MEPEIKEIVQKAQELRELAKKLNPKTATREKVDEITRARRCLKYADQALELYEWYFFGGKDEATL